LRRLGGAVLRCFDEVFNLCCPIGKHSGANTVSFEMIDAKRWMHARHVAGYDCQEGLAMPTSKRVKSLAGKVLENPKSTKAARRRRESP
jgi:hypothetical protein